MVNPEKKSKDGPGGVKGHTALPYHGNTEHPHTRDPYHGYTEIHNSSRTEKRGGRKSNRRKKSMKKKGKTAKKRKTKKARKTRRRKVAGTGFGTTIYREAHKRVRGEPSLGEQREIDAADEAAKAKKDLDELTKIRKSKNYDEVHDIDDLVVGTNYVEFQGADAKPILKNLGQFKREWEIMGSYGAVNVTLEFDNGELGGFSRVWNEGARRGTGWTTVDNVFKVNYDAILSDQNKNFDTKNDNEEAPKKKMNIQGLDDDVQNRIAEYLKDKKKGGGRKRTTRKRKKSRRARN